MREHNNSVSAMTVANAGLPDELVVSADFEGVVCLWDLRDVTTRQPALLTKFKTRDLNPLSRPKTPPPWQQASVGRRHGIS